MEDGRTKIPVARRSAGATASRSTRPRRDFKRRVPVRLRARLYPIPRVFSRNIKRVRARQTDHTSL